MTPREKADKMIKSIKPPKAKGGDFDTSMSGVAKPNYGKNLGKYLHKSKK